ncbi:MAG: hypothetical protein AB1547_10800, partial [Thermodesulfobacteriota bacterium]
ADGQNEKNGLLVSNKLFFKSISMNCVRPIQRSPAASNSFRCFAKHHPPSCWRPGFEGKSVVSDFLRLHQE